MINSLRYYLNVMIKAFKCKDTESLAQGNNVRKFASIAKVARRKLRLLEIAGQLNDLKIPPGNRLEALSGNRKGFS